MKGGCVEILPKKERTITMQFILPKLQNLKFAPFDCAILKGLLDNTVNDVDLIKVLECSDLTTSRRSGAVALRREANGLGNGLYFVFGSVLSLYLFYLR